jgi:hypothetical protein
MPRIDPELQRLQDIKSLRELIKYLKVDLNWPIGSDDVEDVVYDYDPAELGFDSASTAKIEEVCQLRPLTPGQKWGVFWVKFGKKQLPVQMLRRALGNLVIKKRTSTKKADKAAWHMHDLLFISAYGDDSNRHITFAHFSESEDSEKSLPVLKVLGWDEDDTLLHLKDTYKTLVDCLNWETTPTDDPDAWREHWAKAFKLTHKEVISTTKELVVELAHLATVIKKSVLTSINAETDKGPWKKLMLAFQKTLIKDLNEEQFADVIAQTVSYGLLTARLSSDGQISLKNLVDMVPSTNPFLKDLLQHFLTSAGMKGLFDVDEVGINDVVELLNRANAQAIRNDFGKKTDGEDPVIHFYEHFLGAYNKKLKVERGVFYTPKPIVSYIVRSVHELLQKEFGLEDGLADTSTWAEVKERHKDLNIPAGIKPDIEPFVQILDPATGTATFLIEVIDVIHNTMTAKWDKERASRAEQIKKWNTYVPTHLLPRLFAYELMMAPYAIAHMKVGLKLTETGFTAWDRLGRENRANIFLTNALEPWAKQPELPGFNALAHEAAAVNEVKRAKKFTVVIGNPPYSGVSSNMSESASLLIEPYKFCDGEPLGERKHWLQDDYVKFIRLGQLKIADSGTGVLGYITNHGYIDNPTFRGFRQNMMMTFNEIKILDLNGSIKKKTAAALQLKDANVFEIEQGVAIAFFYRSLSPASLVEVSHLGLVGPKNEKYDWLGRNIYMNGSRVTPTKPFYFFIPRDEANREEYESFLKITDAFEEWSTGVQTSRDSFAVAESRKEIRERIEQFIERTVSDDYLRSQYGLRDMPFWNLSECRKAFRKVVNPEAFIIPFDYRPFDSQFALFHDLVVHRSKEKVMRHMRIKKNIALLLPRQLAGDSFSHAFCTRNVADMCVISSKTKEANNVFPLYCVREGKPADLFTSVAPTRDGLHPHNSTSQIRGILKSLECHNSSGNKHSEVSFEEFFYYTYAILHSPTYRKRYASFLKIDFPKIPVARNVVLLREISKIGEEISSFHLLESSIISNTETALTKTQLQEIEKISWSKGTIWLDKAQTFGFKGVTEEVWNFHVGGYQVCEKWLKDRKGRKLTQDDIAHYQKIVVALSETIRLMAEIDKVIDEHGGWPGAFQAAK